VEEQSRKPGSSGGQSVFVYCPIGEKTGGPEALHQLVSTLREIGVEAFLVPTPSTASASEVPEFGHYECPVVASVQDRPDICVVVPESELGLLGRFKEARKVVWWLSLDNSTIHEFSSTLQRAGIFSKDFARVFIRRVQKLTRGQFVSRKRLVKEMAKAEHVSQSEYAAQSVHREFGFDVGVLTDFTYSKERVPAAGSQARKPVVAFNPAKGKEFVKEIGKLSELLLEPIVGMGPAEVQRLLQSASIYLDLGHHPGRDRLPREAAVCGAVVIVGRRGSAAFQKDVPIPEDLKIDMELELRSVAKKAISVIEGVLADRETWLDAEAPFRQGILEEQSKFKSECLTLFTNGKYNGKSSCS